MFLCFTILFLVCLMLFLIAIHFTHFVCTAPWRYIEQLYYQRCNLIKAVHYHNIIHIDAIWLRQYNNRWWTTQGSHACAIILFNYHKSNHNYNNNWLKLCVCMKFTNTLSRQWYLSLWLSLTFDYCTGLVII